MSLSPGFKWFLLLLLPLTLASIGWKVAATPDASLDSSDSTVATRLVTDFLARHHFDVVRSGEMPGGAQVLQVATPACTMVIVFSSPRGWDRDMVRKLVGPGDRAFVVFRGRIYDEQPMLHTIGEFLWSRLLGELGIKPRPAPVLAVTAPANCGAEQLPWMELS